MSACVHGARLETDNDPTFAQPHMLAPESVKAMQALEASFEASTLEPVLQNFVRLRASQMNGCAFCIHMHSTHLREAARPRCGCTCCRHGARSTLYSDRERAALGWTEALTRLSKPMRRMPTMSR